MVAGGRWIWLAGVLCLSLHAADDALPALIEQLQHEDFEIRRTAAEKIEKQGEAARAALEAALPAADPDTRTTLSGLIKKLDFSTVRLIAFDRDGNPAPGIEANVQIYDTSNNDWNERRTFSTTFDASGRSLLEDKFNLRAWMNLTFTNWTVAGQQTQFNLELERGENQIPLLAQRPGKVTFHVQGAEGKPLKDVQIKLLGSTKLDPELLELQLKMMESWGGFGGTRQLAGSTGDDGKVVIENIPEGVYTVIARCEGHAPTMLAGFRVRENDDVTAAPVRMTPRKTGKVTVTLIGMDGKPGKANEVHCTLEPLFDTPLDPAKARRMRQMLLQMRWNGERPQPDEKGKIEFKDVPAGKYRMLAFINNLPRNIDLIEVKGDDTADAGTLRGVYPGGISGRIVDQNGKGVPSVNVAVFRRADIAGELAEGSLNLARIRQSATQFGSFHTNQAGSYDLKNLPADEYVALIQYTNRQAAIFGLHVPADKIIVAPQLTLPTVEKQAAQETKGRVVLADGSPAVGATILLQMAYGSSSVYTDEKGNFRYPRYNDSTQFTHLIALAPGCRPKMVDLTAPDIKPGDIAVKLEKQEYGSLLLNVVDEAGQPLAGVTVEMVQGQGRYYYRYGRMSSKVRTDQFGQARLSGLYAGDRKLMAVKRGYVMKEDVVAKVSANEETEIKIVLRNALELGGTIEVPADYKHGEVYVSLTGPVNAMRKAEGGKFSFHRLPAGDYELGVIAPGLQTAEKQKITLKADQPPPLDIKVAAGKPGVLVAEFPARYQGYIVAMAPPNEWNPEKNPELEKRAYRWSTFHVDKDGRFEQYGVKPGAFDLYLIQPPEQNRYYYDEQRTQARTVAVQQIVPNVETVTIDNVAALKNTPARKITIEPGAAVIAGNIVVENPKALNHSQLHLVLAGPNAYATVQWQVPSEFMRVPLQEPILINAPPDLKISGGSVPGTGFRFESVPCGEYALYAKLFMYNNADFNKLSKPVKLATVTVKEPNEKLELGEIKFTIPAELLEKQKPPQKAAETEYASDEGISSFKP